MSNKSDYFNDKKSIEVAIIGYGSIGRVHGKILNKFGAKITGISCSTIESLEKASKEIYHQYGYTPYTSLDSEDIIKKCNPNCVFICTPPEQHLEDLFKISSYSIPIFCEKPLIWNKKFNKNDVDKHLMRIKSIQNRKLFCNFANNNLLQSLIEKTKIDESIYYFKFLFYTHGKYQGKDIAVDLLPHGIAMLIHLVGFSNKIQNYIEKSERFKFDCSFKLNDTEVEFEFAQSDVFEKKFQIQLNNRIFDRKSNNEQGFYRVWFDECKTNNSYPMENPFEIEISKFLRFVKKRSSKDNDTFIDAYHNTKMLSDLLLAS